jgi:hypothetical protein
LDSALAATDGLGEKELNELVQGLGRQEGGALRWTPDRLGLLLRRYKQLQDAGAMSHVPPLYMVVDTENIASALIDRVLEAPAEAPHGTLDAITNRSELEGSETLRGKLRQGLMQRWKDWDLAQREAAVNLADHLGPRLAADDDFAVWIRSVFRAKAAERAPTDDAREARRRIHGILLGWLPEPTLEDVRAVYDLSDPEQAMQAAMLRRLPRRLEMYRAVSAAAHVPDAGAREAFWARWDGSSEAVPEDVLHAVARGMLGDPDPGAREKAVGMLRNFRDADDLPLLVKALKDPNAGVRRTAALALAEVYDRSAILALAAAVDDPDPLVRAAVLQTLETIKKAEDLKDYWRKFAEER